MTDESLRVAALAYARAKRRIFPCKADKTPLTRHGFKEASCDPARIQAWWDAHPQALIGLPAGAVNKVFVLDIDNDPNTGKDGDASLEALIRAHGPLPATVEAMTPRGGRHLYFRHPGPAWEVPSSASKLGPNLDVRGDGGYVIAPPSALPDGRFYAWEGSSDPTDGMRAAAAPDWLLALVARPKGQSGPVDGLSPRGGNRIPTGRRNAELFKLGRSLRSREYLSDTGILAALRDVNQVRCDPPLAEEELQQLAASVCTKPPGPSTPRRASGDFSELFPGAPPVQWPDPFARVEDGWGAAPEPSPPSPRLVDVPLAGIADAELDPPNFIIRPLLPREHTTLLGSHGGVGKSVLALTLAAHVAAGRRWGGLDVAQGKVLFLSFEDPPALLLFRLRRILTAFSLDPDTVTAALRIIDATEAEPLAQEVSAHGVRRLHLTPTAAAVAELCQGYELIILDNASDCFDAEENSRRQVRGFIRELTRWVKGRGAALLLLVHIDKNAARFGASGNTYSGSTAWHNSARSRLALAPKDHVIELTHEKLNVGPRMAEPLLLAWSEEGVLVPIDQSGRQAALALEAGEEDAAVLRALKAAMSAGETISTAGSGPATAWHCLARFPELPPALQAKPGRERVQRALMRLAQGGVIRREAFKDANRKNKERWIL